MSDEFQSKAAEVMKKVLTVGVGAVFLTEESLRALVSEFKLPKELLVGILESANKTKEEFLNSLSREAVTKILEHVDPAALMTEFLTRHEVELNVKINFKAKNKS